MNTPHDIQWLKHVSIDKQKWDRCIETSSNGLIYGYSFYLDNMSRHWDALVLNDYEAVIPLTWNRKYGIHYLYQPFLTAQLGVFGNNLNGELVAKFLNAIPPKFKYWDIYLNHGNGTDIPGYSTVPRNNYILDLSPSYDDLYRAFHENTRRNIKKSEQAGCVVKKDFPVNQVMDLAMEHMKGYGKPSSRDFNHFRNLFKVLQGKKMATTYGVFSASNELLASAVFFYSHQRAYYILVGNAPGGKTVGASHALINAFIKDHAGTKLILDFEGSDIPNLAQFYQRFGATNENYPHIRLNRLPFPLKYFKK